jgi:hypothetical protein
VQPGKGLGMRPHRQRPAASLLRRSHGQYHGRRCPGRSGRAILRVSLVRANDRLSAETDPGVVRGDDLQRLLTETLKLSASLPPTGSSPCHVNSSAARKHSMQDLSLRRWKSFDAFST